MKRLIQYVRESHREMKKVSWPNRQESTRLTIAVIVFSAIFAAFTGLLDSLLSIVVENLFLGN